MIKQTNRDREKGEKNNDWFYGGNKKEMFLSFVEFGSNQI